MKNFLYIFLLAGLIAAGCGKNEQNQTKTDTTSKKQVETPPVKEQPTDKKNTSDGQKENTNELNMSPGLPADYPADVPQPKDGKVNGFLNSSEGTVVTFISPEKITNIVNTYKDEMKKGGYQLSEGGSVTEKGGLLEWKKGNKSVGLMLGYNKDNMTEVVVTYN